MTIVVICRSKKKEKNQLCLTYAKSTFLWNILHTKQHFACWPYSTDPSKCSHYDSFLAPAIQHVEQVEKKRIIESWLGENLFSFWYPSRFCDEFSYSIVYAGRIIIIIIIAIHSQLNLFVFVCFWQYLFMLAHISDSKQKCHVAFSL